MDADTSFRVNEPGVISEVIEGEAIVLNFASGTYYSMNHSLQLLWDGVTRGLSTAEIASLLRTRYPDASSTLVQDVDKALSELIGEELVIPVPAEGDEGSPLSAPEDSPATDGGSASYEPPTLQKYTDLQELLLLDPIHDVDDAGQAITGT